MKRAFAAFALAGLLAACGGPAETTTDIPDDTVEAETEMNDPLASLIPWNADADAVQSTESGLQYVVLREGSEDGVSPESPRDRVTVMYEGRLAESGETFDSSYERDASATFQLNQVIRGWTEGLQLMSEGDEYVFYIPAELGYGDNPRPGGLIKPGDDLIFRVELQDVRLAPPPKLVDEAAFEAHSPWDSDHPDVVKTGSGLEYVVLASGPEEGASPEGGEMVVVHYEGRLAETGETFDSSFARGEAAMFPSDQLISGWVEALKLMKPGDRWLLRVPSELAYGEAGTPGGPIPPNADLVFEVEMMDVLKVQ